jgi:UDP-N-acetylmuramate--alanine ligase
MELDLAPEKIFSALESFRNASRRFELKGDHKGILVVDDYGHHPTEIRATLAAATAGWGRRIVAAFQPHRYTRSRDLATEFVTAFDGAAALLLTEIYPAGEDPIAGVSAEDLYHRIRERRKTETVYVPDKRQIAPRLLELARPGDMVITMGAGDIGKASEEFCRLLREKDGGGRG